MSKNTTFRTKNLAAMGIRTKQQRFNPSNFFDNSQIVIYCFIALRPTDGYKSHVAHMSLNR